MRKLVPPTLTVIILAIMVLMHLAWPVQKLWPEILRWPGITLLLFGLWISLSTKNRFTREKTEIHPFKQPGKLITDGWFRYSRNPIYLGMALITAGAWIALGSFSPGIGSLAFVLIADRWYITFEEQTLQAHFGQDYLDYRKRVRRWI